MGGVYAGGQFTFAGGGEADNIAYWDPTTSTWSALDYGPGGTVYALAVAPDGGVYVGGAFNGSSAKDIARWDPTTSTWSSLGAGANNSVRALALDSAGRVYAGGWFTTAGGVAASHIARWDPTTSTWSALGAGTDARVYALAMGSDSSVYAGGYFGVAGGGPASRIARWNPTTSTWSALGSGTDTEINALAVGRNGRLSVGGNFSTAGGRAAGAFSQWTAAVGQCGLVADVPATFYVSNRPVVITVRTPGDLACVSIQRDTMSHPTAPADLQTGTFWEIRGTTSAGTPASGFRVDLTLPGPAVVDPTAKACRWDGVGWNCAVSSAAPGFVTRANVTAFSPWTVGAGTAPHPLYLPLLIQPLVVVINPSAIPQQPATERGMVFWTTTITLPDTLPTTGRYVLSSTPDGLSPAVVDDGLVLRAGATELFRHDYGANGMPQPALVTVPLTTLAPWAGQAVTVQFVDIHGDLIRASPMYLVWAP